LTGNDAVNARVIYKSPFTFVPQFKVLFVTNHMPKVDPDDYAMVRRARLFPFNTKFVEDPQLPHERKRDRLIEDKLKEERDGILTKLVNRAFELVSIGRLPEPSHETKLATAQWFMDIDPVMNFINECVEKTTEGCIGTSHLWEAFKQFCMMNNERYTLTQRKFTNNMQEKLGRSFQRGTYMKVQQNVFYGIKLRESPDNRKDF
jgi:putative DNA primase/helicase